MPKNGHQLVPIILLLLLFLFLFCSLSCDAKKSSKVQGAMEEIMRKLDKKRASPSTQEDAARGLLQRLLPNHVFSFNFKVQVLTIFGSRTGDPIRFKRCSDGVSVYRMLVEETGALG